jgi:thymidylate synthase (FAD)
MLLINQRHEILNIIPENNKLLEFAGRTCYKSEGKITDSSADKFIDKILHQYHHESVIEHSLLTVKFITNRGVTHELVRHRLASFSQESTRYVKYDNVKFIIPVWLDENELEKIYQFINTENTVNEIMDSAESMNDDTFAFISLLIESEVTYKKLIDLGWKAQQAREVLSNALKTEIIASANFREWRHILKMRTAKNAHPQIRELMIPLLNELKNKIPVIFDDIKL